MFLSLYRDLTLGILPMDLDCTLASASLAGQRADGVDLQGAQEDGDPT